MKNAVIVIGNGESRLSLNLAKSQCTKIGCNAVARDCYVDRVVCVDKKMVYEICNQYSEMFRLMYTRKEHAERYKHKNVVAVPALPYKGTTRTDDPFHWGSGPYAVLIAAMLKRHVSLVGFDLWSKHKSLNNVYKGTENYPLADKRAVDPRYWIHQISQVFKTFPAKTFTIYQTPDWYLPQTWNLSNVRVDRISNFT